MAANPLDYRGDQAKVDACGRLEGTFGAAIGAYEEDSVHVEVKPRFRLDAQGEMALTQVVGDNDLAQIVSDVNTLGNVAILDLSENDISDTVLPHLKDLQGLSELYLGGTKITPSGIADLQAALPDTTITSDI